MTKTPLPPLEPLDANLRYSIDDSRRYLKISRARLYVKIKAKEIRIIKDGDRTFIPGVEILRHSRA